MSTKGFRSNRRSFTCLFQVVKSISNRSFPIQYKYVLSNFCLFYYKSLYKCGCDDGLECQVTQVINVTVGRIHKVLKIRQCRAVEEKVIPRKVDYEADEPRQKRLFSGIIGGVISGGINTLLRVSMNGGERVGASASPLATDSCEKSQSTLCQKSWIFSKRSGFLPQGKLSGWVRMNIVRKVNITIVVKINSLG